LEVVGSDGHGDMNIDSVVVIEADELTPKTSMYSRAGGLRDQVDFVGCK
jgi:hypothetical protein